MNFTAAADGAMSAAQSRSIDTSNNFREHCAKAIELDQGMHVNPDINVTRKYVAAQKILAELLELLDSLGEAVAAVHVNQAMEVIGKRMATMKSLSGKHSEPASRTDP
ncbi:hypothetical protein [Sphingomonas sp. PP-CC-3G-468]|uniref:hypothetical protein n=1 Tax=Sphingomonas sp. PP-CC-3G-468 TaxID=2135656 RepID=UPI0010493815|nr:hypothetical protein [Sphingomonas sp. PP-CC-3G-468]TCM00512.1 hypothetical protein C8J41_12212 [Sphingomonas sp. PP-CC-3G-468]